MKRTVFSILLLAIMLVSCDPGYHQYYVFQNNTSHNVTIVALMDTADMYFVSPVDSIRQRFFHNIDGITIPAGENAVICEEGGLGVAGKKGTANFLQSIIYSDSVRFEFDDGRYLYYHCDIPAIHSPYDDDSYTFEGEFFRFSSKGTSTYVLDNEDYARSEQLSLIK